MDHELEKDLPAMTCPTCGHIMQLVGIERDLRNTKVHLLTFECRQGHVAISTLPIQLAVATSRRKQTPAA
jgi:hypothetical protein